MKDGGSEQGVPPFWGKLPHDLASLAAVMDVGT
jgi:hypothetical protein